MALFGKKKEVVDLRPRDADMPIPAKMRERLISGNSNANSSAIPTTETTSSSASSSQSSGSGFFGFFGGSDSSSNSAATPTSSTETNQTPTTDFWGNSVMSNASSSSSNEAVVSSDANLSSRISKMIDRLELVEMKLDRLERKVGIKAE